MNKNVFLIAIALVTGLFFVACDDDDDEAAPPVIDLTEVGYENSKIAYAASDLHIEAEIVAEGTIDVVQVKIHAEGEDHKKSGDEEWELDTTFTEFSGKKNTTFHKHVNIAKEAEEGEYHFDFIVTDMNGYQSSAEVELEIQIPTDSIAPEINVANAPSNNPTFANGETISISGTVNDETALGGMYIGLVRMDQNLADTEVNDGNTITLLHTHDFDSNTAHGFSAEIVVGAAKDNNITPKDITGDIAWQSGNYYIVVKCKDAFGGNWTFSSHYPLVLNL